MSRSNFREVFTGKRQLLPELPLVGWSRAGKARVPGLIAHKHEELFEIFLFERGGSEWWVENEVHYVSANQVFINRPNELHGSVGKSLRPCGYYWINLSIAPDGLPGTVPEQSMALCDELASLALRTFPGSPALKQAFAALWKLHRDPPRHHLFAIRAQLHLLLVRLLQDHHNAVTKQAGLPGRLSFAIQKAVEAVDKCLPDVKSIGELAKASGLGVTQFSDRFLAEVGFTPAMYVRRQRVERAKALIHTHSVADIAQAVGFSSSQHLATIFKQFEGITPTQYRETKAPGR